MHSLCTLRLLIFFQNGEYLTRNRTHFAHLLAYGTLAEMHLRFARGIELFESTGVASPDALGFAVYVLVLSSICFADAPFIAFNSIHTLALFQSCKVRT